jgi:hypothetical protein
VLAVAAHFSDSADRDKKGRAKPDADDINALLKKVNELQEMRDGGDDFECVPCDPKGLAEIEAQL